MFATYISTLVLVSIMPYYISNWFLNCSTLPYTLAFSNTPGLNVPISIFGKKYIDMTTYVQSSSHVGLTISCISYVDFIKFTCVSDDTVLKDPRGLISLIEKNISECGVSAEPVM